MTRGTAEVFWVALKLGLSSFGGPIAHLGYFERTYVRTRHWLTHAELSDLIALCQILPGPTSSQVGFLIGHRRAGLPGALAAWAAFTLPSALLMLACALWAPLLPPSQMAAIVQGLKLVAVMVVAQALWQMARVLCPDGPRALIALLATAALLWLPSPWTQLLVLAAATALGSGIVRAHALAPRAASSDAAGRGLARISTLAFATFLVLQAALLLASRASTTHGLLALSAIFYRAGSLVFGGGHVVLPLLRNALVPGGWISDDQFLAGYGAAQALPGPVFAFAAYVGALLAPAGAAWLWASVALASLFAPGLLLALAGVSVWGWLAQHATARAALAGLNAAVVGLLAAAFIDPVCVGAIHQLRDLAIALAGFLALQRWRVAPLALVLVTVLLSMSIAALR